MPIYEYECPNCQRRVSLYCRMNEEQPATCPVCGSQNLMRLVSPVFSVKSSRERVRDVSWIDRDLEDRFGKGEGH